MIKMIGIVQRLRSEIGSTIIITALGLMMILMLAAFVIDVGQLYLTRVWLVNAVDSAALSAVRELPHDVDGAMEQAKIYAAGNGVDLSKVDIDFSDDFTRIDVSGSQTVQFFFAGFINHLLSEVRASSSAKLFPAGGIRGTAPFGVQSQDFQYGIQYHLKYGAGPSNSIGNGNYGALALGGGGANRYEDNIRYGYQDILRVGDIVHTEPGNMSGPTVTGVNDRINSCYHTPSCTYDNFQPGCLKLIYVPVVEGLDVSGGDTVEVVGFAAFFLEGTMGSGNDNYVVGRFIEWIATGESSENSNDYGLYTYKLVK